MDCTRCGAETTAEDRICVVCRSVEKWDHLRTLVLSVVCAIIGMMIGLYFVGWWGALVGLFLGNMVGSTQADEMNKWFLRSRAMHERYKRSLIDRERRSR